MPNVIGPEFWYFDRRKVLNEVVFRAPPSIDNYTSLTHLVLIDESLEDVLFQTVVEFKQNDGSNSTLNEWLRDKHTITINQDGNVATLEIQLLGDDGRLSCAKHWLEIYNKISDIKIYDDNSDNVTYFKQTAVIIDMGFNELIKAQPEKLIFGSYRDIIRSLYQQIAELEAFGRIQFTIDYKRLKKISRCFHELLVDNRLLIRKIITLRILSAMKETKKYPPSLGGIMDKFKKLSRFNSNHDVFDEDVINLELPWENPRLPQLRVRWMRSDRYWTYTFFETTNNLTRLSPDAPSYPQSVLRESRHLSIGRQAPVIKDVYISEFRRFAAIFISFFFAPSVLEAPSVVEMVKDEELPGRLLAGAHYIFVPFGVIIYAMYWPEHTVDVAKEHLSSARDGMRDEREREVCEAFCQAARTMKRDNQELFSELKEIIHEWGDINLATALEISIVADESIDMRCNPKELPSLDGLLSLGEVAWEKIKSDSNGDTERLGIVMTRLCIELWSAIRQQPGHKRRWSKEGDTDFSACYIEKRRAIYVSNFQPSGEEGFTRTIFIDLALNGYQRGRVAQRLCDVATCRSLAVIDINRVRAIIGGMNELSIELNRLQELEVGIFANRGTDWKEQVDVCNKVIEGLDEIRQELDQMNWLVVYGMKGRYLAGNVLLSQIEDRIEDLAEDNFDGAQGLGEYLRRRVKEAMRDVNRMSEKYDYLRDRIRESFDRVRTRLNLIETSKTSDFTRITAELAGSLLSIIKKLSDLDEAQGTWKVFANLSLIIAGTYTIMELLKDVAPHADLKISLVVTLFVVSICVLILKIVIKRKK